MVWGVVVDVRLEGDAGACGVGSEKMRAPGEGRQSHEGVSPIRLGISDVSSCYQRFIIVVYLRSRNYRASKESLFVDAQKLQSAECSAVASLAQP